VIHSTVNCNTDSTVNFDVETVQVTLFLRDLVLRDSALTRLENLHDFSNLRDNFRFNAIWH
jgi:hypothetical protein